MIEFYNIHKSYGHHEVLKGINNTFEENKITMLLGASGSGKSTMIRLINRLIDPDRGQISIHGKDISKENPEYLRRSIGYAIQGVGLFPHMNVRENIAVVPNLLKWDKKRIDRRVDELLELMGIPESFGSKKPSMLSGGEAQRIGVARALGANPDILLMDEPFGALDPVTRTRLQQEFMDLQKKLNKTVIFVTHDIGEAVRMGDEILLIQEGQIVNSGSPKELAMEEGELVKTFFGNQFTIELLEKYRPKDHLMMLNKKPVGRVEELNSQLEILDGAITFRDAMVHMIKQGSSEVFLNIDEQTYSISFSDLIKVFGGAKHG